MAQESNLSENDAAVAFARAWNTLEAGEFLGLLSETAVYESQYVMTPLKGKEAISEYLRGKMETVKNAGPEWMVLAEVRRTAKDVRSVNARILPMPELRVNEHSLAGEREAVNGRPNQEGRVARIGLWVGAGRPCVAMSQAEKRRVVLFEVRDGKVSRVDLCIGDLIDTEPLGTAESGQL